MGCLMGVDLIHHCHDELATGIVGCFVQLPVVPSRFFFSFGAIDFQPCGIFINCAKHKHEARKNDRQLYETADNACCVFIMTVVDETWYKELKDPDTFYTKVTSLKLLDHLTEFCAGLHTVDAVDIPQLMKEIYKDSDGVP